MLRGKFKARLAVAVFTEFFRRFFPFLLEYQLIFCMDIIRGHVWSCLFRGHPQKYYNSGTYP